MRIISLEVNELPPDLLRDYIETNPHGLFSTLQNQEKMQIHETCASDINPDQLYPSQTWATQNSGSPYAEHQCYWYSDPIDSGLLIWNRMVKRGHSVGVIGCLHSSKLPPDLNKNPLYKFYIPDCFSREITTKPESYEKFQELNVQLVSSAARSARLQDLGVMSLKFGFMCLFRPNRFGINSYSLKSCWKIFREFVRTGNLELVRLLQFPLLGAIFAREVEVEAPDYSALFSNHVAGNMHRYWYAHKPEDFEDFNKYPSKWVERNSRMIMFSVELLEDYITWLRSRVGLKQTTIVITSSMGQEATKHFSDKELSKFDGKIANLQTFLEGFDEFCVQKELNSVGRLTTNKSSRNMAPQYGFWIVDDQLDHVSQMQLAEDLKQFVSSLGLSCDVSIASQSLVLSLGVYGNRYFHRRYTLEEAQRRLGKFGFQFFAINDHHSGSHCPRGTFAVLSEDRHVHDFFDRYFADVDNLPTTAVAGMLESFVAVAR